MIKLVNVTETQLFNRHINCRRQSIILERILWLCCHGSTEIAGH